MFAYLRSNHTSVVGMWPVAAERGAVCVCVDCALSSFPTEEHQQQRDADKNDTENQQQQDADENENGNENHQQQILCRETICSTPAALKLPDGHTDSSSSRMGVCVVNYVARPATRECGCRGGNAMATNDFESHVTSDASDAPCGTCQADGRGTRNFGDDDDAVPYCLFAYPAQCNFSGTRYPLEWVRAVQVLTLFAPLFLLPARCLPTESQ